MGQLKNDLLLFYLQQRKDAILERWNDRVIALNEQLHNQQIKTKGQFILKVVLHSLSLSGEERETYLSENATIVAKVKNDEQTKLENLILYLNVAKNEIFNELNKDVEQQSELAQSFMRINEITDQFLYFIVKHFSDLEDQIIEEKNLHLTLSHEERLTLLGQMTSSFVHEFRNPLTTVHGFVQLLRAEYPDLPYMDIISAELDQLTFRITQFLMLSKKEITHTEKVIFLMNDLLEQIANFVYPRLLELNVSLKQELEENLFVKGTKEEIRQVLINIIFNAIEVMNSCETCKSAVIHIKGYKRGDSIVLETSNSGPKIPDSLLKDIFQPFVTTKETGTGLGLYVSKGIIEEHGGQLLCESDDSWTTFTIILPTIDQVEE